MGGGGGGLHLNAPSPSAHPPLPRRCSSKGVPELQFNWPPFAAVAPADTVVRLGRSPWLTVARGRLCVEWHYNALAPAAPAAVPPPACALYNARDQARRRRQVAADAASHARIEASAARYASQAKRDKRDNADARLNRELDRAQGGRLEPRTLDVLPALFEPIAADMGTPTSPSQPRGRTELDEDAPGAYVRFVPAVEPQPVSGFLVSTLARRALEVLQPGHVAPAAHALHLAPPPGNGIAEREAEAFASGQRAPSNAVGCVCAFGGPVGCCVGQQCICCCSVHPHPPPPPRPQLSTPTAASRAARTCSPPPPRRRSRASSWTRSRRRP